MRFLAIGLAAFFVIAGQAVGAVPRNSVGSAQVKPNSLKGVDINEATLGPVPEANSLEGKAASDFQLRVSGVCDEGEAIFAVNADGTVDCLPVGAGAVSWDDVQGKPQFATVATSGAYADLTGRPSLAAVATTGAYGDLTGTPLLATVATTGAYSDLTGEPSLAAVATSGAWDDIEGVPADLADGDDGASYTAGAGLTLTGTQFAISGGGVNSGMLAPSAVVGGTEGTVLDNSLTADDVAIDAIGASELAAGAVTGGLGGDLQDNSLTTDDIGPSAVQASELANGAVVGGIGGDILDNSVTSADLAVDTWNLTGNLDTNPGNQFLGTIDAQPLQLRTDNVNRLVISAAGAVSVSGTLAIGGGTPIAGHLSTVVTVPGPTTNVAASNCDDFTQALAGAAVGDTVAVGPPNLSGSPSLSATGYVQSAGTVAVRICNAASLGSENAAGSYRVDVWKH